MRNSTFLFFFFLFQLSFAQDSIIFSGKVLEHHSQQPLDFATVSIKELNQLVYTDENGAFSMVIPSGKYHVTVQLIDYEDYSVTIHLKTAETQLFYLKKVINEESQQLDEVKVSAKRGQNIESSKIGVIELEVKDIKTLPSFMGEVDIIKTVQSLPGVSSVSEGSQGFYVRGGGPDQNLVLLDGAQIYNASHLFGFFSVFNVDAISSMSLSKGGMTADYGGRISSLMEIKMREGDMKRYHVNGGIGLISSRLEVDGPIQKDKSSFMVAARRTYIDVLMKPFLSKKPALSGLGYYFYDLNFKFNFRLSSKDRLFISSYLGKDNFKYSSADDGMSVSMPWGNQMASIRWNHLFSQKHFMNVTGFYTGYDINFSSKVDNYDITMGTGIRDAGGRIDFTWLPNIRHRIRYGVDYVFHRFTPATVEAYQEDVSFDTGKQQRLNAHESAVFIADDWDITEKWRLNIGLRYSMYQFVGPFDRYEKGPVNSDSVTHYSKGDLIAFHNGWEPRISTRILLGKSSSIKAGFSVNYQYVHLASLTSVAFPSDLWVPSTEKIKPQSGWQATAGYFKDFFGGKYETSIEIYYKHMYNLVEFANGSMPTDNVNDNVDNQLINGKGWSYGAEFFVKKVTGKLTGWIGYTWAKSERMFPEIQATPFPSKYDRRHDLNLVLNYKISDRWTVSANFVYATGNTLTMPSSWYIYNQEVVMEYGGRNSTRMPDYHRLDLSATWFDKPYRKKTKIVDGEEVKVLKKIRHNVNFSVYNVYNRANPYFLYLSVKGDLTSDKFAMSVKQVSLFPILPSVTWNFEF